MLCKEAPSGSRATGSGSRPMVAVSPKMLELKAYLLKVSATDSTILITGETGTGKELVAEWVHRNSPRQKNRLVGINCAALPDGLLESELFGYERGAFTGAYSAYAGKLKLAQGGTVLFDEIGEMSPYAQAKILRVIESRECYPLGARRSTRLDFRIIAATNQDLEQLVSEKKFRKDLFYRLNVVRIHLPPLRERREDIPLLIHHYLRDFSARLGRRVEGLNPDALTCLLDYPWPGNIRELKNLLEALLIDIPSHSIRARDLPERFHRPPSSQKPPAHRERDLLLSTLFATNWNKTRAAQELRWSRMTLYRKMAKYDIQESKPPRD